MITQNKCLISFLCLFSLSTVICMQTEVEKVTLSSTVDESDFRLVMGRAVFEGKSTNEQYDCALNAFIELSKQEENQKDKAWGFFYLGKSALFGYGISKDEKLALNYFKNALMVAENIGGLAELELLIYLLEPDLCKTPVIDKEKKPCKTAEFSKELRALLQKSFYLKGQRTVLSYALAQRNHTAVEQLLKEQLIDTQHIEELRMVDLEEKAHSFFPLEIAIAHDDQYMVELVLDHELNAVCQNSTRLHVAARHGSTNCVDYFLKSGDGLESLDPKGRTPLFVAARAGQLAIVKLLVIKGACVDPYVINSWNPLVIGYKKTASLFSTQRKTALCAAIEKKHRDVADFLLDRNAQFRCDEKGRSYLRIAVENGDEKMALLLLQRGAPFKSEAYTLFESAAAAEMYEFIALLFDKGFSVAALDEKGYSLLCRAVNRGDKALTELVIEKGADVNSFITVQDTEKIFSDFFSGNSTTLLWHAIRKPTVKVSPLRIAVANNYIELVKLLIEKGADVKNDSAELLAIAQKKELNEMIALLSSRE